MIPFALLHALPTLPRHYEFPPRLVRLVHA